MILDNAPWHKKAIRLIWTEEGEKYSDIRNHMEYVSLPPNSPDLNPIEQVWRKTRREKTHNRYFNGIAKLIATLDEYFFSFAKPNESLRSLCSFKCFV
jgi:transposase